MVGGGFIGGPFGRRTGPTHVEDPFLEQNSAVELDLLDRLRQQQVPHADEEVFSYRSNPEVIGIRGIVSLKDRVTQILFESDEPMSAADIAEQFLETRSFNTPQVELNRPRRPRLIAGALSNNSQRIIGENGVRRFEEFKRYAEGWDYGRGRPLSAHSVATLEAFLRQVPELAAQEPSLFLTHDGNLQLGWEDAAGGAVELEFFPDRVEYYIESLQEEDSVGLGDLRRLVDRIRPTTP